jgi:hypothetical protein
MKNREFITVENIGPITEWLLSKLWKLSFDPTFEYYMPDVIKNGVPSENIPSYDPYPKDPPYIGPSNLATPTDYPQACAFRNGAPYPDGAPNGNAFGILSSTQINNLHYVNKVGNLAFDDTNDTVTLNVQFEKLPTGGNANLINLQGDFQFNQPCKSTKSGVKPWITDPKGTYFAELGVSTVTAVFKINIPTDSSPPTLNVQTITFNTPGVTTFDIQAPGNLPSFIKANFIALAKTTLEGPEGKKMLLDYINEALSSSEAKKDVDDIINKGIAKLWNSADFLNEYESIKK